MLTAGCRSLTPPTLFLQGGIYHGRILMPAEYPFKPPAFVMLTPSGRFETGVKICLSISSHHPESWQPSWSVRSALVALIAFMQTPGNGALGSLDHPTEARRQMAAESRVLPPRFGTEERRELIAAMHQRMLELEPRSRAVCCQERVADAGPEAAEAAAIAQARPPASPQAAVQPEGQQPPLQEAAQQQPQQQQQQPAEVVPLVPAARPDVVPAAPEPAPVLVPAAPATPAEPELRQRAAAAAASPVAPPMAAAQEAAPAELPQPQYRHGNATSWEDRGLTYLAVLLALCIAALLARKVRTWVCVGV